MNYQFSLWYSHNNHFPREDWFLSIFSAFRTTVRRHSPSRSQRGIWRFPRDIAVMQHILYDGVRASAEPLFPRQKQYIISKSNCFAAEIVMKKSSFRKCAEENLRLGRRYYLLLWYTHLFGTLHTWSFSQEDRRHSPSCSHVHCHCTRGAWRFSGRLFVGVRTSAGALRPRQKQ